MIVILKRCFPFLNMAAITNNKEVYHMKKYRVLYLNETEGMIFDSVINAEDNLDAIRRA